MPSTRSLLHILWAIAAFTSSAQSSDTQAPLVSNDYECEHPPYKIHMVSKSPLVVYLAGFLTPFERDHLRDASLHTFAHSQVTNPAGGQQLHRVRTSQSTNIPRDAVARCIEARALAFQGFDVPASHVEPLQLVRYRAGERYHFHTDWFPDAAHATAALGGNRVSSFFAYVYVSNETVGGGDGGVERERDRGRGRVRGGGTNFPLVDAPRDERWCAFVDCDEPWDNGVTFRPIEGNAVYWENMLPGGRGQGDPRTLHAGLPVVSGEKIGMNIWTRQAPLGEDVRGPDV